MKNSLWKWKKTWWNSWEPKGLGKKVISDFCAVFETFLKSLRVQRDYKIKDEVLDEKNVHNVVKFGVIKKTNSVDLSVVAGFPDCNYIKRKLKILG